MKKYLLFAAAVLCMVACNSNDPKAPQKSTTIHATINMNNQDGAAVRKIQPNASDLVNPQAGGTVNFHWEDGDEITIFNVEDPSVQNKFQIIPGSISKDGKSADFSGTPLADMSNYLVSYGRYYSAQKNEGKYQITIDPLKVPMMCRGTGKNAEFELDYYTSLFRIPLTGTAKISKVTWTFTTEFEGTSTTTYNLSSSVQLSSTATIIYLPLVGMSTTVTYNKLSFYGDGSDALYEKEFTCNGEIGTIYNFSTINIESSSALSLHMTTNGFRGSYLAADNTAMATVLAGVDFNTKVGDYEYYVGTSGQSDFNAAKIYSEKVMAAAGDGITYECYVKTGEGKTRALLFANAYGGNSVVFGSINLTYSEYAATPTASTWDAYQTALSSYDLSDGTAKAKWYAYKEVDTYYQFYFQILKIDETKEKVKIVMGTTSV